MDHDALWWRGADYALPDIRAADQTEPAAKPAFLRR
jgi:hypothetical protein